jgi:hypothetical protein
VTVVLDFRTTPDDPRQRVGRNGAASVSLSALSSPGRHLPYARTDDKASSRIELIDARLGGLARQPAAARGPATTQCAAAGHLTCGGRA